ncbi:IS1249 family transposase [Nesterenkonia haasae]|uniref:IS1249 family transposase n=1 Tax=Nesterenkonia haasae TaxID=2587813 RepID=UPI002E2C79A7|nr:IS1249 family transposase [Nesterenkonia haasae]
MTPASNQPVCGVCGTKLVKNGKTSAGRTRWRCKGCGSSATQSRADVTRKAQLNTFLGWLLGKTSQRQAGGGTGRSLRFSTAWCWNIEVPPPEPTGEVHRQIIVDGTYFNGWCALIAHNGQHVIGWQWCDRESKAAWVALFKRFPAPDVVVTDGGTGLRAALDQQWRRTRIQRCFFHIRAAVVRHTTLNPRLEAGQEILALTRELMRVQDLDAAAAWMGDYAWWEAKWSSFLKQRTYAKKGLERPVWAKPNQNWWYTHIQLRRVQGLYRQLIRDKSLFTFLDQDYVSQGIRTVERATSRLEGGPNSAIKHLLRHHRGMPETHTRKAVDWLLNSLTEHPHDPRELLQRHHRAAEQTAKHKPEPEEPLGPQSYGTATTAEEGLWARKGGPEDPDTPGLYTHSCL